MDSSRLAGLNLNIVTLNVRGLNNRVKRRAIFRGFQETHSTREIENFWKNEWYGKVVYAHGDTKSRGVAIFIRGGLDFQLEKVIYKSDDGRVIFIKATIQDHRYKICNIYAPNIFVEQKMFFRTLYDILNNNIDENDKLIIGGDFNSVLDKKGGVAFEKKDITKLIQDLCVECHLIDIWRIRHPEERAFTWRNPKASISCRLDFWLISVSLQDYVENIKIVPCIKSDHSAVSLHLKELENSTERGAGDTGN